MSYFRTGLKLIDLRVCLRLLYTTETKGDIKKAKSPRAASQRAGAGGGQMNQSEFERNMRGF